MIIFMRHGKTASNEVGKEKLRGLLPVPLDLEGMKDAREVAEKLATIEGGVDNIYCATVVRVVQTAEEVAQAFSMVLKPLEDLNDWDTGDLAGKPVNDTLKVLHDHIKNPEKVPPNGKSFQSWLDTIVPRLVDFAESDDINVVVSSGRVSTVLKGLIKTKGKYPPQDVLLLKPPIDPSGLYIIDKNWNLVFATKKSEETKGLS